jgi:hypothetical protein
MHPGHQRFKHQKPTSGLGIFSGLSLKFQDRSPTYFSPMDLWMMALKYG